MGDAPPGQKWPRLQVLLPAVPGGVRTHLVLASTSVDLPALHLMQLVWMVSLEK